MQKLLKLGFCLSALAFLARPAEAAFAFRYGPFPDFVGTLTASASVTVNTGFSASVPIPFDGTFNINTRDRIQASVSVTVPVYAASFFVLDSSPTQPFNPNTDSVFITDVYALNTNPTGDPNHPTLTGFNAANPQFTPLGPEQYISNSGTVYTGSFGGFVTLANLAMTLPGFDLPAFVGDQASIVYIEQTSVPALDAMVPEPGSLTLLGLGLGGVALVVRGRGRGRVRVA